MIKADIDSTKSNALVTLTSTTALFPPLPLCFAYSSKDIGVADIWEIERLSVHNVRGH